MIRIILREMLELINEVFMFMPVHIIRKVWIKMISHCGHNCVFMRNIRLNCPWRINMGNDIVVNRNVILDGRCSISIGDSCDIGEYVCIWTLEHDIEASDHGLSGASVIIEDHVWIAPHCIILPGVSIGRGSVIATGSVVTKSVPEHCLYGGIPAKKIKDIDSSVTYQNNYKAFF